MLAHFGWIGTALLAILLAAMVIAAWEQLAREAEQHRRRELWTPDAQAGAGAAGDPAAPTPSTVMAQALSRAGRRPDPNWIETRPMVNLGAASAATAPPPPPDDPAAPGAARNEVDVIVG